MSLNKIAVPILALPRTAKRFVVLSGDLGLCVITVWAVYYLRLGEFVHYPLAVSKFKHEG